VLFRTAHGWWHLFCLGADDCSVTGTRPLGSHLLWLENFVLSIICRDI